MGILPMSSTGIVPVAFFRSFLQKKHEKTKKIEAEQKKQKTRARRLRYSWPGRPCYADNP